MRKIVAGFAVLLVVFLFPALAHAQSCPQGTTQFLGQDGKVTCDTPMHHYGIYCPQGWTPPPGTWCSHREAAAPPDPPPGPEQNGPHMLYGFAELTVTD